MDRQIKFLQDVGPYLPALFDESMLGVWRLKSDLGLLSLYGNSFLGTIYGEDLTFLEIDWDKYLEKYCHPDDREKLTHLVENARTAGVYRARHRVWNRRKRTWMSHYVFGTAHEYPDGRTTVYGYARDISDAILLENAYENLHVSERSTVAILDATPLANTLWDENLNLIDCNLEAVKMLGSSSKAEYVREYRSYLPTFQPDGSDSAGKITSAVAAAFISGREVLEFTLRSKDGVEIPSVVTLVRIKLGDVPRVAGYARDLRELKSTLERMHEADERTQAMLDSTPLACTLWDENCNIVDCNLQAPKMFGFATKQEYMDNFDKISPEFQSDGSSSEAKARENIAKAAKNGREVFEWTHVRTSGELIPAEITLFRIPWYGGFRVAGYARDLRELKATIAKMERAHDDLRNAVERAEESSRAKSEFLSNMSHEIRTPMNAIIGMTGIAKGTDDVGKMRYCLGRIDDASNHLLGVINDILDMSKIEAGKLELSETEFSVEKMLFRITSVINFRVDKKEQNFIIKVAPDVPETIVADQQRLAQVITNLLSNAAKFTPDGGRISLLVDKSDERDGICTLRFKVSDNGIGISDEQIGKLFKPFVQADGTITRRFGGTGLGLAISKNIVEAMGGEISVHSEVGAGSEFTFTIKAGRGEDCSDAGLPAVDDAQGAEGEVVSKRDIFKGNRVMLVDDIEVNREIIIELLEETGVDIDNAENGEIAWRLFEADPDAYDLILMDVHMPVMDGYEATRRIRAVASPKAKEIPIIAMTANVFKEDIDKCLAVGMNEHVGKPVDIGEIIGKMKKYLC